MKKLGLFLLSIWAATFSAQQVEILLEDSISIRAIVLEDQKVWYAGTDSKFGYVNILSPADERQIRLSDQQLQFRTLAQDRTSFYAINIESPAHLFKISKRDLTHQIVFTDTARTAFYDAMHFVNIQKAYAFSDADESLNLKLLQILPEQNSFAFYRKPPLKMNKGEAALQPVIPILLQQGSTCGWVRAADLPGFSGLISSSSQRKFLKPVSYRIPDQQGFIPLIFWMNNSALRWVAIIPGRRQTSTILLPPVTAARRGRYRPAGRMVATKPA